MVAPLLNTTIKGAVWYQGTQLRTIYHQAYADSHDTRTIPSQPHEGEADAGHPGGEYDGYNCTFPAMIQDWRSRWSDGTTGETSGTFPFGFVQLNSVGSAPVYDDPQDTKDDLSPKSGYAGLRWSQSASVGYAPNAAMPNTFMAVSVDTPDNPFPTPINGRPNADPGFSVHRC
jgi:sialate O-acetylesterase